MWRWGCKSDNGKGYSGILGYRNFRRKRETEGSTRKAEKGGMRHLRRGRT